MSILGKGKLSAEESGRFYFSAGSKENNIYLLTAHHVDLIVNAKNNNSNNREYYCLNNNGRDKDITVINTFTYIEKVIVIDYTIRRKVLAITNSKGRIVAIIDIEDTECIRNFQSLRI